MRQDAHEEDEGGPGESGEEGRQGGYEGGRHQSDTHAVQWSEHHGRG